jgi:protein-tyrosine-phosphatase
MAKKNDKVTNYQKKWAEIVAHAWSDETFKQKLLNNASAVLKEHGIEIPEGKTVEVHEQKKNAIKLVLPMKPKGALSDAELKKLAAGTRPSKTDTAYPGYDMAWGQWDQWP